MRQVDMTRRDYYRAYQAKHRERLNEYQRKYRARRKAAGNPVRALDEERQRKYQQSYWRTNRVALTIDVRRKRRELKRKAFEALGGAVCARCGFEDVRALQFDHIHGGGNQQRSKNMSTQYAYIIAHTDEFQVLCANCNWIKRDENREASAPLLGN